MVGDLTADAFIAAFKRLTSRRGRVRHMYGDNGTNFVSADKLLLKSIEWAKEEYDFIHDQLAAENTTWHFSPPGAPHFNGLAEAGVKSVKSLLKKVIGETIFTFEELCTLLSQIEAVLNTRPLCPLSSETNDTSVLTPGHFLVGSSLSIPIDKSFIDVNVNWLSRWQLVQRKLQDFWKQWTTEYLNLLQTRTKWGDRRTEPQENDLVLIRDEALPPAKWPMAKIIEKHPGKDGITRVVTVKTRGNIIKRPITKIAKLPINASTSITKCFKPSPNSRNRKTNIFPILTTMLAICITGIYSAPISKSSDVPFTTTSFDNPPLIYFEDVSSAFMTNTRWNIITFIDLHVFNDELDELSRNLNNLYTNCKEHLIIIDNCEPILDVLKNRIVRLKYNNEFLINPVHRQKTSAFNIIGNILYECFGVLDNRFEEMYAKDITQVTKNEEHLMQLMRNQTSVIDATVNILKKTNTELITQSQQINEMSETVKTFNLRVTGTT